MEFTNSLAGETSPYLLQHAHNPVEWYPWGEEALAQARSESKLILLSIGYSACHWCHVMERESFEDEQIAAIMNEHFVNIKVDREERPDLDEIYMAATLAMNNGQGGWPMTIFLTPDLEPVFAGTYFPPHDAYGRPGFSTVLTRIAQTWRQQPDDLRRGARHLVDHLREQQRSGPAIEIGEEEMRLALAQFAREFDPEYGGFGPAPKFPPATSLSLLLRLHRRLGDRHALKMVCKTLDAMASGGMYDHVGGGFARYATDREWLVPHFEKMLYDNALLAKVYLEAYQVTKSTRYRTVAEQTLDYIVREMISPEGGIYSSTDADSEGQEGKFFVWTPEETVAVLGALEGKHFNAFYDITPGGNWEGRSIPNTPLSIEDVAPSLDMTEEELTSSIERSRARIYQERSKRVKPGLDDKILTAWNGMMISALAQGYRVLRDVRYLDAATRAADFILSNLVSEQGKLLRTFRSAKAHTAGYLEDYAHLSEGLLDLSEASGEPRYAREAQRLATIMARDFADRDTGALCNTSDDHDNLIVRFKNGSDGATPSANAVAAFVLARLSYHLDRPDLRETALGAVRAFGGSIGRYPKAFAMSLCVLDFLLEGPTELAVVGTAGAQDLEAIQSELALHYLPNRIQAIGNNHSDQREGFPLLRGKSLVDGKAALYVCRDFACQAPISDITQIGPTLKHALER
ncbi:MAG: thioredoxin domain-containing protein [Gemmatimonadales bacterium]